MKSKNPTSHLVDLRNPGRALCGRKMPATSGGGHSFYAHVPCRTCEAKAAPTQAPYKAVSLFVENAPNVWAVMKRATPGAREFNGEVMARCPDEASARTIADALNAQGGPLTCPR